MKQVTLSLLLLLTVAMSASAADRHWVGTGSGNGRFWDRTENWSTTTGGAGGAAIPTASDDVFLDGGTGDVIINVPAVCLSFSLPQAHNVSFSGNNTLTVGAGGYSQSAGAFDNSANVLISVAGDFSITGGTFDFGTAGILLNGTSNQDVTSSVPFGPLEINNSAGVTLGGNITVDGVLTLTAGSVTTNGNTVTIGAGGSIVRVAGFITGAITKPVATGATSVTFELGSGGSYVPVTIAFGNVATAGNLTVGTTAGDHPQIAASQINHNRSVNRHWTATNSGIVFNNYAATFTFAAPELDAGANTSVFNVGRLSGGVWSTPTTGARTSTTTQATGLTAFSDFVVGHTSAFHTISTSVSGSGAVTPAGPVSVLEGSDTSFTIAADPGHHIDSVLVDGVNQGAVTTVGFTNVTGAHSVDAFLSVNVYDITAAVVGNGTVTPSGVSPVNHGDSLAFTITPDPGYHIDSVLTDGVNQGAIGSFTFTNVTADHLIAAFFSINVYSIAATATGNGSISPSGVTPVDDGDSVAYTMTPDSGHHIDSVVIDGVNQGALGAYTFTNVASNHTIDAYFSINVYDITAAVVGNGTVTPSGVSPVNHGDSLAFTITPDPGHHIDSVLTDGVNQGAIGSFTFTNVTANHLIAAFFSVNVYDITSGAGANGSISPSGVTPVNHGDSLAFTITPDLGYFIADVQVDSVSVGAVSAYTFTNVSANHTISASFSLQTFMVDASAGPNGSVTPSGTTVVGFGDSVVYAITPDLGYFIADVQVDSVSVGPVASYTFTNVTANHTISATFAIQTFIVDASGGPNGQLTPAGNTVVNYGDSVAYAITPDLGYFIADVQVDSVSIGPVTAYTFTNVTANHTISATFSIQTFGITASAGANGSVTPAGLTVVNFGGSQAYAIAPDSGYFISDVFVDSASIGPVTAYTFSSVTANHTISATFAAIPTFSISASSGPNGQVTPAGVTVVTVGSSQVYSITPDTGYFITDVFVDSVSVGPLPSYTFVNVTANHTISATFAIQTFSITASAGANGSINPSGVTVVSFGGSQGYTITADTGYFISDVFVDSVSVGPVSAWTFTNVSANHLIQAFFVGNTAPTAVNLFTPADDDTLFVGDLGAVTFSWSPSSDPDPGVTLMSQVVSYTLSITGPSVNFSQSGISDTSTTLDLSAIVAPGVSYDWTVSATDGIMTVASPDTFTFHVNLGSGVADGGSTLPEVYALGQNYPNPFNPSTTIRVDLPEQSSVTLKLYNILGAEVLSVLDETQIDAGRFEYRLDLSSLPSGAYFYRIEARGESGATFGQTRKMVLMK